MPDLPQVPRVAQILGPAIDAWVAARPSALRYINLGAGRYADIPAGWEAQVALIVRQIADEVISARLAAPNAGVALTQLASSEFTTFRNSDPTKAVGRFLLSRTGSLPGGAIPAGFRFSRPAAPAFNPPIPAAAYVASRDVSVAQGATTVSVPMVASLAGSASNAPYFNNDNTAGGLSLPTLVDTPFDTALAVTRFESAGGSDGEDDDDLRRQAMATSMGSYGPTVAAILAGALSGVGVHQVACFDVAQALDGSPCAYTGVAIADQSWSSGYNGLPSANTLGIWEGLVGQLIADNPWQGVGGQVIVTGINNILIRVGAAIALRSGDDLKDTTEIDAAVLAAARSYFDDRPDWYTWTSSGLRAFLSRAHPKILSCTAVTVYDLVSNAALMAPANQPAATQAGINVNHYYLANNGVTPTYSATT